MNGSLCKKKCKVSSCSLKCSKLLGHDGTHLCLYHRFYHEELDKLVMQKAEEHWVFLEKWLHMIFTDAFIHGYKHAKEEVSS